MGEDTDGSSPDEKKSSKDNKVLTQKASQGDDIVIA